MREQKTARQKGRENGDRVSNDQRPKRGRNGPSVEVIAEALFPTAPTVPEDVRVGIDDGGVVEERQLARQLVWKPEIVLIEEGDRFAPRHPDTSVTCCTLTCVFLPSVLDAGITPCVGAGDRGTPIRRTVVDHEKLKPLEGLRQHRFDRGR